MKDTNRVYGYARVSTQEQSLMRQVNLFKEKYNIMDKDIYVEKISGRVEGKDRPTFSYLINVILRKGDCLVLDSISRLGRSYTDLLKNWNTLNELEVYIVIDDMPLLDTRPTNDNTNDLVKNLIINLVTNLLAFCAQKEVDDRKRAQMQGIEAARKTGKQFGRPRTIIPDEFGDELKKVRNGKQTATAAMRKMHISHSTYYRMVKLYDKRKM